MIAAGMEIQLLRLELADEEKTARFRPVERSISNAVAGLRNLIFELEPPESSTAALEDNITQYLEHALGSTPLDTQVTVRGEGDLEGPQRQVLFRNLREAALNAVRHGGAHELMVGVDVVDDGVMVTVTDDGKGMKPGEERKAGHHGMRVMCGSGRRRSAAGSTSSSRPGNKGRVLVAARTGACGARRRPRPTLGARPTGSACHDRCRRDDHVPLCHLVRARTPVRAVGRFSSEDGRRREGACPRSRRCRQAVTGRRRTSLGGPPQTISSGLTT